MKFKIKSLDKVPFQTLLQHSYPVAVIFIGCKKKNTLALKNYFADLKISNILIKIYQKIDLQPNITNFHFDLLQSSIRCVYYFT